jgi:hypothetical protein
MNERNFDNHTPTSVAELEAMDSFLNPRLTKQVRAAVDTAFPLFFCSPRASPGTAARRVRQSGGSWSGSLRQTGGVAAIAAQGGGPWNAFTWRALKAWRPS